MLLLLLLARWPDGHAPLRPHPLGRTLLAGSGLLLFWFWQMNDAALNAGSGCGSGSSLGSEVLEFRLWPLRAGAWTAARTPGHHLCICRQIGFQLRPALASRFAQLTLCCPGSKQAISQNLSLRPATPRSFSLAVLHMYLPTWTHIDPYILLRKCMLDKRPVIRPRLLRRPED